MKVAGHPIADAIRSLITPAMKEMPSHKGEVQYLNSLASQYEKPFSLGALDSERSQLAADLASHNAKEPVARYTAEKGSLNVSVDNAVMKALREIVYPQADTLAGKPQGYFNGLKEQQANLIRLESLLNKRVDELTGKSRVEKGTPALSRLRGGTAISGEGVPHGYISGLTNAIVPPDVLKRANHAASAGFSQGGPISKAHVLTYPARALALDDSQ